MIDKFRIKLLARDARNGVCHRQVCRAGVQARSEGFGEYGFPESHAASFALLVYVSAWLKYHLPSRLLPRH